eukprot:scaffold1593_cov170-Ochromonas_danica.AAC.7
MGKNGSKPGWDPYDGRAEGPALALGVGQEQQLHLLALFLAAPAAPTQHRQNLSVRLLRAPPPVPSRNGKCKHC